MEGRAGMEEVSGLGSTRPKARPETIPAGGILALGAVGAYGAEKYGDRDWETRDEKLSSYYGALIRHAEKWWAGEDLDESGENHLAHVAYRALQLLWLSENRPGLDDRPHPVFAGRSSTSGVLMGKPFTWWPGKK